MIFHPVSNIKDKDEFIELINIYCRLVEVMAERNRMPVTNINQSRRFILIEKNVG